MTWFKVDDKLHAHPKILALLDAPRGLEALGMWTLAGSHCAAYHQGGVIPLRLVGGLVGSLPRARALTSLLITAGLWEEVSPGIFTFHDWHRYNLTAEQLAEIHEKKARAGQKGGLARAQAAASAPASRHSEAQGSSPDPDPDPVPIPKEEERTVPQAAPLRTRGSRGSRIPEGWQPTEALLAWCHQEGVDGARHVDEFVDYWRSTAGQKGVKVDWEATFKNRIRTLKEQGRTVDWSPAAHEDDGVVRGPPSPEQLERMRAFVERPS